MDIDFVCLVGIFILIIMFAGEPDIHDGLVKTLNKTEVSACEQS